MANITVEMTERMLDAARSNLDTNRKLQDEIRQQIRLLQDQLADVQQKITLNHMEVTVLLADLEYRNGK